MSKNIKIDPKKVKKEELQGIFSKVLDKLKKGWLFSMEKLWIECQKCGSVFWVYSEEISTVYPKKSIDYQICTGCEQKIIENKWRNILYLCKMRLDFTIILLNTFFTFLLVRFLYFYWTIFLKYLASFSQSLVRIS